MSVYYINSNTNHQAFADDINNVCAKHVGSGPHQIGNLEVIAILSNIMGQIIGHCATCDDAINSAVEACLRNLTKGLDDVHTAGAAKPNA